MLAGQIQEIVIIGAGRLASSLGLAFFKKGLKIVQVYNRTPENGKRLANRIDALFTSDVSEITLNADCYFLAVSDSALPVLTAKLQLKNRLVVHASGSMEMNVLAPISKYTGVFYPVQTFSQKRSIDFRNVPVCIEGNSVDTEQKLAILAKMVTERIFILNSEKRRMLHLGAVFSSNFSNFMYAVSEELLLEHEIPFDLLKPLILQTAQNVKCEKPFHSQTGPAVRGDSKVLEKHRELLSGHPDYLEIYNMISKNIIKHKSLHGKL